MASLSFTFEYAWRPFTVRSVHLSFEEHQTARLSEQDSSDWGPAVYKWEGTLKRGEHSGLVGVLIGETDDVRGRIKQYVSGTQESGNRYWREQFLTKGDIRLHTLSFDACRLTTTPGGFVNYVKQDLASGNFRLILEQLLVQVEVGRKDPNRWVVNRKL